MANITYRVSAGEFSSGITVNEGDFLYVLSSGGNVSATVNSGGVLYVSNGGYDGYTKINSEGMGHIFGSALYTSVGAEGYLYVYNSGSIYETSVASDGVVVVQSGGNATGGSVASDGSFVVESGGSAAGIMIASGGHMGINIGKNTYFAGTSNSFWFSYSNYVSGIELSKTKDLNIYNTASANDIKVNLSGHLNIYSGGSANLVEVTKGGEMNVYGNAVANRVNVKSGGEVVVHKDGKITGAKVSGGISGGSNLAGELMLMGVAESAIVASLGLLTVGEGGEALSTSIAQGGKMTVAEGGNAVNTLVGSSGTLQVSGGAVSAAEVDWKGNIYIDNGGNAQAVQLASSAYAEIGSGGVLSGFTAATGARFGFHVDSNTIVSGTSNGAEVVMQDASLHDLTYSGNMWVYDGAVAERLTIISGYGAIYSGGKANAVVLKDMDLTVEKGGIVSEVTVESAGSLQVSSGASVDGAVVSSGGEMYILSGGCAVGTEVASNAQLLVSRGGVLSQTTVNEGGYVNGIRLQIDNVLSDQLHLSGGLISAASNSLVVATAANLYDGQSAEDMEVRFGSLVVNSGGTVNNMQVNSNGYVQVMSGALVAEMMVNQSGLASFDGGSGSGITADAGGWIEVVNSGSIADAAVMNQGQLEVYSNGMISSSVVTSGGNLWVDETAVITEVRGESGAVINGFELQETNIFDGALTIKNANASEYAGLFAGQKAAHITVDAYDVVIASEGSEISDVVVNKNGSLQIDCNAVITGEVTLSEGCSLLVLGGGIFRFDVSERSIADGALVNDFSLISGSPVYDIVISEMQNNGSYKLAKNASDQLDSMFLSNTNGSIGEISVNGKAVYFEDMTYRLENISGNLTLSVSGNMPYQGANFTGDTNGCAQWAVSMNYQTVIYDANGEWSTFEHADLMVIGSADFNNDGMADLLFKGSDNMIYAGLSSGNSERSFEIKTLGKRDAGWRFVAVGDFDADGYGDVMFANDSAASKEIGLFGYWNIGAETTTWQLVNGYDNSWEIVGQGDFNGDGAEDILWKNTFVGEGALTYNCYCSWSMNVEGDPWQMVSVADPSAWKFLASGDFDGNGTDDIAMINGDGVVGIWGIENGTVAATTYTGADGSEVQAADWVLLDAVDNPDVWTLAGVADYNGDGTDDIAWCNAETGLVGYWQVENKQTAAWVTITTLG